MMALTEAQRRDLVEGLMDFGILRLGVDGFMYLGNLEFVRQTGGMNLIRILGKFVSAVNASIDRSLVLSRGELPYFHFTKEGLQQKRVEEKNS
jgi:hypothetical protein